MPNLDRLSDKTAPSDVILIGESDIWFGPIPDGVVCPSCKGKPREREYCIRCDAYGGSLLDLPGLPVDRYPDKDYRA